MDSEYLHFFQGLVRFLPWMAAVAGAWFALVPPPETLPRGRLLLRRLGGIAAILLGIGLAVLPSPKGVVWTPYSPAVLEKAVSEGRPVVIDFFADWCVPCHHLDRYTYSNSRVVEVLEPFERVKIDMTRMETPENQALIERFGLDGVPTVVFLDAAGTEFPGSRLTGFFSAIDLVMHVNEMHTGREKTVKQEDL